MMNHSAIWTGIAFASLAPLAAQQEAFRGSLAQYLALDEKGVTIGDSTFHHFRLLPLQQGASGFSTRFINVVPLTGTDGKLGFRFEIMDGATIDDFFELKFAFEATGPGFVASLIAFAAPGGLAMLEDRAAFSKQTHLKIEVDAVLDGGNEGVSGVVVASLEAVNVTFVNAPPLIGPPVIRRSGLTTEDTFFIEFTSAPSTPHTVTASTTLADGFPISVTPVGGPLATDATGFARVEIDLSTFPPSAFFKVKASS